MAFRRGGAGKRRDANEAAIVEALQSIGCEVWQISGRGVPDLLVWRPCVRRYYPMEIKTATGKQKPSQVGTPWPIVRSVDQAIRVVNGLPADGTPSPDVKPDARASGEDDPAPQDATTR